MVGRPMSNEFKKDILEAIGNTPIVRLNKIGRGVPGELFVKCEFMNPGGSIKDRIGKYMVEQAEAKGLLKPGGTIVESTSGNTGVGLAITAAVKGYQSIFVMPDKMSEEKRQNLRAFGARVVITPTGAAPDSPQSHYSVGERLTRETPNAYYTGQYHNTDNRDTHYQTTGPEIWEQTGGQIDAIVCGMGTCGTITGLGKFFKEKNPKIQIVGVDPKGSILKDLFETGKMPPAHTYKVEGIGEDIVPNNLDFSVIDKIVRIEDKESFLMTRQLLTKEGMFCGMSSGSAVVGALRYMAETPNPGRVLVILPDSGNRYLSKVFNDAWMIENSFLDRPTETTVAEVLRALNKRSEVFFAQASDKIETVVARMRDGGISQLPVQRAGQVIGVIAETDLLRPLLTGQVKTGDSIESLVQHNYEIVRLHEAMDRLTEVFTSGKIALVEDNGQVTHVLTKIDLIGYLSRTTGKS
ncbi:cystathionine beta-synthase [bacterium]|nr:cystathionine beta-synthase [bacterium]